jgi:hypothetical protein
MIIGLEAKYWGELIGVVVFTVTHSLTLLHQNISPIVNWQILNRNPKKYR